MSLEYFNDNSAGRTNRWVGCARIVRIAAHGRCGHCLILGCWYPQRCLGTRGHHFALGLLSLLPMEASKDLPSKSIAEHTLHFQNPKYTKYRSEVVHNSSLVYFQIHKRHLTKAEIRPVHHRASSKVIAEEPGLTVHLWHLASSLWKSYPHFCGAPFRMTG